MAGSAQAVVLVVFVLASSIWVGGYVAIGVVARVATRTLDPAQRVSFFRTLGRSYLLLGGPALLVALGTGAALLTGHAWDATAAAAVVVAAALVSALAVGVVQARRMTTLRSAALSAPADPSLAPRVRRGGGTATVLRASIGVLTLVLVALGAVLAT